MKTDQSIFGELNVVQKWYAVHTKARHEKRVHQRLNDKGVNSYLPINTVYRRWSDRYKKVQEPLFSCYVFVRIALKERLDVLQTDGVVNLVSSNGIPASIPDNQIEAIRKLLSDEREVSCTDYFTPGKKVKVVRGLLKDLEGTMVAVKGENRLVITIDSIKQAISVEINPGDVELM
ncbi:UpxY family transcription antiterminator [candidate division KSB1 bacterium]|nr:UpxY family transcription antiterminator [candidate division KSB1 bacterium]